MDDYMRREHERDRRESSRHPRGPRLTIQPMNANNLGCDYRPLPGLPPVKATSDCPICGGCGITPGWMPSYNDPCNSEIAPEAEPCICRDTKTNNNQEKP